MIKNYSIFIYVAIYIINIKLVYAQGSYEIDYIKSNKNNKEKYYQVPNDEILWAKYQSVEPLYFFEGKMKGYGWFEPLANTFIAKLRSEKFPIYVDYFTPAKSMFYVRNESYDICRVIVRTYNIYKKLYQENIKNKSKDGNKFIDYSIPFNVGDKYGLIAISTEKLKYTQKHLFKGTTIYNIKSLLDDENLYTIQVKEMASGLKRYIYLDGEEAQIRNPKYSKDRVYEFVASSSEQIPLMLRGKRMDCAPRSSGKGNVVT